MRLRGISVPDKKHRHSVITERLYESYIEKRQISELLSTQILTKASIISHNMVDIETEQKNVTGALHNLRSCMPYLTQGKSVGEALEQERQESVNQYHAYLKETLGEEGYHEYLKEQLGEEKYQEFIKENHDG